MAPVIVGSGLTIAGATFCLSFARLPYFTTMGAPVAIGMVVVVLADGNWLANQGRSDIADSVQAAFVSLAAAGPKGSQVSVVTYAEAATVVKSAVPLAELASVKLTPGPTGPKAQRALAQGITPIVCVGETLAEKFPYIPTEDKNELPDEIIFGK